MHLVMMQPVPAVLQCTTAVCMRLGARPVAADRGGHGRRGLSILQDAKRGNGSAAVFIARNRFAVLDKSSNQLLIKDLNNEITKKAPAPVAGADGIFYAGTGALLVRSEDKVAPRCVCPCCRIYPCH
jgi:hypothetical protein